VFTRISTVAGGAGSVDTHVTFAGLRSSSTPGKAIGPGRQQYPVFFIQDAIKFPDLVHAVKMEPTAVIRNRRPRTTPSGFYFAHPESMHTVMWIMSDRTLPRSLRMIEGFGVHSFRLINESGESTLSNSTGVPGSACNPPFGTRPSSLPGLTRIFIVATCSRPSKPPFPEWEFSVQLFTQKEADKFRLITWMRPS